MPNPLDLLLDPISLAILAIYALLMFWEALFPARVLPAVKNWQLKGILAYFVYFYLSSYLPLAYEAWLPETQLLNLGAAHPLLGGIAALLLFEFGLYVWHRSMHKTNILWRFFHQMHHSAERLDTYGAFYFSPMDMIGFTVLNSLCFSFVLGLPAQSVTILLLSTNFFSIFQHANIKTPSWLGYLIQRPESHAMHHCKGVHAYNYSDLPLFDLIFGTFRNPESFVAETGFYPGASERMVEMLLAKDVSAPKA